MGQDSNNKREKIDPKRIEKLRREKTEKVNRGAKIYKP